MLGSLLCLKGKFQFDLWGVAPASGRWDWEALRREVKAHGARNSLLVAPMPTASTSQILGNNECFEPFTSNLYTRRVLSGEFIVVNKYLLHDLIHLGLWNESMKDKIIANNGSIQNIAAIPPETKALYKTVWELPQRVILDMSIDRAPLHMPKPEPERPHGRPHLSKNDFPALSRVGAWVENRHVLPALQASRQSHSVHRGQDSS